MFSVIYMLVLFPYTIDAFLSPFVFRPSLFLKTHHGAATASEVSTIKKQG